jgi:hypothetical protein
MTKSEALDKAIEIAKEYARSGGGNGPDYVLGNAYKKIVEIANEEGLLYSE